MRIPNNRKGFKIPEPPKPVVQEPTFEPFHHQSMVYWQSKLSHTGVIGYKVFDGFSRGMRNSSLSNLLNYQGFSNYVLFELVQDFKKSKNDDEKSKVNDQAIELLDQQDFELYLQHTHQARKLNPTQSRKISNLAKKMAYYTQKRQFHSKKTGNYSMRVAFLTLTAPGDAEPKKVCDAFNHFLDYLQRTANCVYIWKKELGEQHGNLHFHLIINNFIPYYIISWKWKRLLLAQNVKWTIAEDGADSESHYRIELPKNRQQTAHYIAKYMSKAYSLPGEYGYISGHSKVLDELKEVTLIENDWPQEEIKLLTDNFKVIRHDHVSIICCDLLELKEYCPVLGALFEKQYIEFSERITLPQRFTEV